MMDEEGDELTDFEKTLEITKGDYEGWEGKTGFTLFQFWREGFLKQLNNEAYLQASEREFPRFEILTSFTLIDQAYLDNFFLAIVIKLGAEKAYD
ncbi:MAG: hypothetical protein EOM12_15555, partial [Verrucomicrobiae bacterium]|nr:hypothetical protein [Verrucomicrobiae bacterium]